MKYSRLRPLLLGTLFFMPNCKTMDSSTKSEAAYPDESGFSRSSRTENIIDGKTVVVTPTALGYDPAGVNAMLHDAKNGGLLAPGVNLKFENLDPLQFPEALPNFVSNATMDQTLPIFAFLYSDPDNNQKGAYSSAFGNMSERMTRYGLLPSPFRYQYDASVLQMDKPYRFNVSLGQTLGRVYDAGETGDFLGQSCFTCHAGMHGNIVAGGSPNKDWNPYWYMKATEDAGLQKFGKAWEVSHTAARAMAKLVGMPAFTDKQGQHLANITNILYPWYLHMGFNPESSLATGADTSTWEVGLTMSLRSPTYAMGKTPTPEQGSMDEWLSLPVAAFEGAVDLKTGKPIPGGKGTRFRQFLQESGWEGSWDPRKQVGVTTKWPSFPVSGPRPWWYARYTGYHFWNNVTRHNPANSAGDLAVFLATPYHSNPRESFAKNWQDSVRFQTYMDKIQSPTYPKPIDAQKARGGAALYEANCARCHGTFTPTLGTIGQDDARYTLDYNQEVAKVYTGAAVGKSKTAQVGLGTDDMYSRDIIRRRYLFQHARDVAATDTNNEAEYKLDLHVSGPNDQPYYYAPPLVGVWASAPYLHNNSVPTVLDLLTPPGQRPTYWRKDAKPYEYDYERLGVKYNAVDAMPPRMVNGKPNMDAWMVYDTTIAKVGMRNTGHDYGTQLSMAEKLEIVEFLKHINTKNTMPHVIEDAAAMAQP